MGMKPGNNKYRFPWRSGNSFQLLIDGRQFYPCMLDAINEAKTYICLETYLMESGNVADRFIEALIKAHNRGVMVYLFLDDYGSMGLDEKDRQKLVNADVQLVFHNPVKMAILDLQEVQVLQMSLCPGKFPIIVGMKSWLESKAQYFMTGSSYSLTAGIKPVAPQQNYLFTTLMSLLKNQWGA